MKLTHEQQQARDTQVQQLSNTIKGYEHTFKNLFHTQWPSFTCY